MSKASGLSIVDWPLPNLPLLGFYDLAVTRYAECF
jgi:hypothetical protein